MGGKCAQALFNTLLIADIRKHIFKYRQLRSVKSRDMQARLPHEGKQSHSLKGDGLAAGVWPGYYK